MEYAELIDPSGSGVEVVRNFVPANTLGAVVSETHDPQKVQWLDAHATYTNKRGLEIVQNHYTFAHKISHGDQGVLEQIPETVALYKHTERFIQGLAHMFPSLAEWQADEFSFHLYDDERIGLSKHRDNLRFVGVIAIIAIEGECDLVISDEAKPDIAIDVQPGDLCLLRGPGLIDSDAEVRPEHSVQNLRTPTRTSMMLRANTLPDERIPGFRFNNW